MSTVRPVSKHAAPGRRERKTRDKRQRIRMAARELFSQHGYESTTLRQIAQRADVGLGTLFHYAKDKRDLIFLIFNEEFATVTTAGLEAVGAGDPLIDQLLTMFAAQYHFLSNDPVLARILLRELIFYSEGMHSAGFLEIRKEMLLGIRRLVRRAQQERRLDPDVNARVIGQTVFFVFAAHVRWWIARRAPHPSRGLAELRELLNVVLAGLEPVQKRRVDLSSTRSRKQESRHPAVQ